MRHSRLFLNLYIRLFEMHPFPISSPSNLSLFGVYPVRFLKLFYPSNFTRTFFRFFPPLCPPKEIKILLKRASSLKFGETVFRVQLENVIKMEEEEDECRYSCLLVSSAFAQLIVYLVAVGCTVQALQEGSIFKVFEIEEVGLSCWNYEILGYGLSQK